MGAPLSFSVLHHFLDFAKVASEEGRLNHAVFGFGDGSYSSLLLNECQGAAGILRNMKMLSGTLSQLTRLVEEGLNMAYDALLPGIYKQGIERLPAETVAHIFDLLPSEEDWYALARTSRHFWNIAVKMPKLWTTYKNNRNPRYALERSGSRAIDIICQEDYSGRRKARSGRFFELLEPHQDRWKSLSIRIDDRFSLDAPHTPSRCFLSALEGQLKWKTFPLLETLKVDYGTNLPLDEGEDLIVVRTNLRDANASLRSFFSTWEMPALRCIDAVGFVPLLPPHCPNTLTSCRLTLGRGRVAGAVIYDLKEIVLFLHGLRSIEKLAFRLCAIEAFLPYDGAPAELLCLKRFDFYAMESDNDAIQPLVNAFSAPNLNYLCLHVDMIDGDSLYECMQIFFPSSMPRWHDLQSISCSLRIEDIGRLDDPVFDTVCMRLPQLQHLTLSSPNLQRPAAFNLHRYYGIVPTEPRLRSLRLEGCKQFDTWLICDLAEIIKAPEFERLEIYDCPCINADLVRRWLPESKEFDYRVTDYGEHLSF